MSAGAESRTRSALVFAAVVVAAQALCFAGMFVGGELIAAQTALQQARTSSTRYRSRRGEGVFGFVGVSLWLASVAGLALAPVGVQDWWGRGKWAPRASRRAVIMATIVGLLGGYVVGRVLAAGAPAVTQMLVTRLTALVGSLLALFLTERLSPERVPGEELGLPSGSLGLHLRSDPRPAAESSREGKR